MNLSDKISAKNIIGRIWSDVKSYAWVGVFLAVYYVVAHELLPASCPLILLTGFPCAGCGMTRAVTFVLTGQFVRAFYMNPLAFIIVLFGLYCCFYRYILGRPVKGFVKGMIFICILVFLTYFIRMYLYFPNRVPYVYMHGNMMERRIPGYGNFAEAVRSLFSA